MKMKTQQSKFLGYIKGSPKRKVYCNSGPYQEARKVPNTQPNITSKGARKGAPNEV